ncbi:radical SAM family heme chaperone HemW [Maritimibacter alkaliphilus]|uniref:radical SAM family heme chaperone HemW n=1 Tax=Maritimibacter alkaliphilus TaxID=404236 RepID=UPI001C973242|nr:radical SAM family heme chaperone HemW [Maritimibacter alkaliphilus]MBY6090529.1 radical SAM family heme chaperone HemW [Maritimibacter alkaliphilus]
MPEDWQNGGFGLYLHWPFCEAKCPYCDFNSHVVRYIDQRRWLDAYLSELDRTAALTPNRILRSVFFGGGTPSLMEPEIVSAILERIRRLWPQTNDIEVTLEANPGSVEAGRFRAYAQGGVNRVSLGVQALNDDDLRRLGRIHDVAQARAAFDIARDAFDRVSFDLIYARQNQTTAQWRAELSEALSMAVDHLSLYQLTIEQGTAFGDRYNRGKLRGLPDEDSGAEMYEITQELTEAAGMPAYEVSNHARAGAESRHNLIYWNYGDYIGIGPGAHGRLTLDGTRYATETVLAPGKWLELVESSQPAGPVRALEKLDQAEEFLMMGLRLTEGIDPERYHLLAGTPLPEAKTQYLSDIGMIRRDGPRLKTTKEGRLVLNAVISEYLGG